MHFFESHDPTQYNRQGNDIGTQYRSTILYSDDDQKEIAEMLKEKYQNLLSDYGYGSIKTIIEPLDNFYLAEEYHQDYLKKNPNGFNIKSTGFTIQGSGQTAYLTDVPNKDAFGNLDGSMKGIELYHLL